MTHDQMTQEIARIVLIDQDPFKLMNFIAEEIEKVENPDPEWYKGKLIDRFEECRQKILNLFKEE